VSVGAHGVPFCIYQKSERAKDGERHRQTRIKVKDGKKVRINVISVKMTKERRNSSRECVESVVD
jgi:hypothetical protein